jgi:ribosomal protein S4
MCVKNIAAKSNRYKFFKVNLWGRLFVLKNFKGRRVMYARINRRHTLRKIRVNAMKLRRKTHTIKGLGILAAARLKNFYLTLNDFKLKTQIRRARKIPYYKLQLFSKNNPLRVEDRFVSFLESRVENVLHRTGWLSIQAIRQLLSHRKVLVNNKVTTRGSVQVKAGDVISFREPAIKKALLFKFFKYKLAVRKMSAKYKRKNKYPMLQTFITTNKLKYMSVSL